VLNALANSMCHEIGIPRQLKQNLKALGRLEQPAFHKLNCCSENQVMWQNWPSFGTRPLFWKKHSLGGYCAHTPELPELDNWVLSEEIAEWQCDIRDIQALAASKSPLESFSDLDTFALNRAGWCIQDVSVAGLQENLAWEEVRITEPDRGDWLQVDLWEGPRVSLINSGGSHHFSAARWVAGRLGQPTPITGRLVIHSLNASAVNALSRKYSMVAIHSDVPHVWEAIQNAEAHVIRMYLPYPAHDYLLLMFPVDERRSLRVAELFLQYGALDVNHWLQGQLGRQAKAIHALAEAGLLPGNSKAA